MIIFAKLYGNPLVMIAFNMADNL